MKYSIVIPVDILQNRKEQLRVLVALKNIHAPIAP
jgi:hypothetical protein